MLGVGLLAIWNDVEPGREDELDLWHVHEHLPERVSIPGFLRARRYIKDSPPSSTDRSFLTLYETESADVMASAPYLERLDDPTPLTRKTLSLLANMRRSALRQVATRGGGVGGFLSVWQFRPAADLSTEELSDLLGEMIAPVGVIAAHAYAPEVDATRAKDTTSEGRSTQTVSETSRWVVLVEGINLPGVLQAREGALDRIMARAEGTNVSIEEYRLAVLLS